MSAITCPGCGAAAKITEHFTLASTDGPVAHVALSCAGGHHYRMPAEKLPARAFGPPAPPLPPAHTAASFTSAPNSSLAQHRISPYRHDVMR